MKIYIYWIACLLCFAGCGDFLDETLKGTLIPKTVDDFAMMLDSYDSHADKIAYGNCLTDAMDDDVQIPEAKISRYRNWGIRSFCWEDYIFSESENDEAYNSFYHVIYICNYILDNLETAKGGGTFSREYVEGAARFHRANAYFNLVNLYARHYDPETAATDPGVVLLLKADVNAKEKRASVQAVYDCILEDLDLAEDLLDDTAEYTFRASKAAVYAMLGRVYLYLGEYGNCLEACRKARAITGAPEDYNAFSLWGNNPDNGIDGMSWDTWELPDIICYKWEATEPCSYGYNLSDELMELFDKETDLRWSLFVTTCKYGSDDFGTDEPRISVFFYPGNRGYNVGEVYITEAEAAVRENDIDGALWALNELARKRHVTGMYTEVTERDPEKLLRLILDERRREQMFKGTRWFDLKRLNRDERFAKTVTHVLSGKTYTLAPDDNHYVLPIPLKAIAANDLLEQNPR